MKIAVIGGGISGISAARLLQKKGEVVVFEKANKPGGLIRCDVIDGHLFHRTGGHVFNAKNKFVQDWFWSHFDKEKEFVSAKRNAKILMNGKLIGYPIENYIYQLDKPLVEKILSEILEMSRREYRNPFTYDNFSDFLIGNFGPTLYQTYFEPYNRKIWNTNLEEVPLAWLDGKLPMPNYKELLLSNIFHQEETSMVHSRFYYPKNGGSQFIIDRLAQNIDVVCNTNVESLQLRNNHWILNGSDKFDHVVYTGDVRQLEGIITSEWDELKKSLNEIKSEKSNGTSNMLCETDDNDISWLYLPGEETKAHRIIYTGNLAESNNGRNKRRSCVIEFSGHVIEDEIKNSLRNLPGNLSPICYNYQPNSYVIQNLNTRRAISNIKVMLQKINFHLTGRFAEWEYYNMDKAIESAIATTEMI